MEGRIYINECLTDRAQHEEDGGGGTHMRVGKIFNRFEALILHWWFESQTFAQRANDGFQLEKKSFVGVVCARGGLRVRGFGGSRGFSCRCCVKVLKRRL